MPLLIEEAIKVTGDEWVNHPEYGHVKEGPYHGAPINLAGYRYFMAAAKWTDPWPDNGGGHWGDQCGTQYSAGHHAYTGAYDDSDRYGPQVPPGDDDWAPIWREGAQMGPDPVLNTGVKFYRTRQLRDDLVQRSIVGSPVMGYGVKDKGDPSFRIGGNLSHFYGLDIRQWAGQSYDQKRSPLGAAVAIAGWTQLRCSMTLLVTGGSPPASAYVQISLILIE